MPLGADNDYEARVFRGDNEDNTQPPLMRALHAELCRSGRSGQHAGDTFPACLRAFTTFRKWKKDGQPGLEFRGGRLSDA